MMNYRIFTFIFLVCLSNILLSQDTLVLKKYTPPDFNFSTFFFSPSLNESSTNSDSFKRNYFRMGYSGLYNRFAMKGRHNINSRISLINNLDIDKINDTNAANRNLLYFDFSASTDRQYYFSNYFLNYGGTINYDLNITHVDDPTNDFPNNRLSVNIPLGFGIGRVYNVSFAWQAMTLLDDLERYGATVNRTHNTALADYLLTNRYTRVFDNRLKRIYELEQLYAFIQEKNILAFNPRNAALLYDSWANETFVVRRRGTMLWAGFNTEYTRTGEPNQFGYVFNIVPTVNIRSYHPINKNWQLDHTGVISYSTNLKRSNNYISNENVFAEYQIAVGWFPSRRINARVALLSRYDYLINEFFENSSLVHVNLLSQFNYYFNPRMILNLSFNASFSEELDTNIGSSFSQTFQAGFQYAIW